MSNPLHTSIFLSPEEVRINGRTVYLSEDKPVFEYVSDGVTAVTLTLLVDDLYLTTEGIRCEPPSP